MGLQSYLAGFLGENKACHFLKKQGFELIKRNFHSKFGEIDIIAQKEGILHFIEVKFTQKDYEVSQRLDKKKLEKIFKTIDFYHLKYGMSQDFQVDLICIKNDEIQFCENINF
ncbi:YraN family protein [Campylobacter sp. VicNov18]|uniref:YraN family protein n=1 Tax=Campylobacter bilis TaxID=2691918 RepID=UPI00130D925F|nr:YraN family protein [Campylobacter bilis]MPV63002.1 YraN family protein [Campylobacter hepaticus]MBM0636501.1 YraN family protein [Campylobacter bilis]MCC8277212.1 YraN family protein [Campylobacter bilis]MCC8298955.1 YraN family protein [Campylobacter bilis]MCC8300121.1 YraN family protein [Campylobacter bilis]